MLQRHPVVLLAWPFRPLILLLQRQPPALLVRLYRLLHLPLQLHLLRHTVLARPARAKVLETRSRCTWETALLIKDGRVWPSGARTIVRGKAIFLPSPFPVRSSESITTQTRRVQISSLQSLTLHRLPESTSATSSRLSCKRAKDASVLPPRLTAFETQDSCE